MQFLKIRSPSLFFPWGFPGSSAGKYTCNAGGPRLIPGSGRSPGEEMGYPLQCSWASLVTQTQRFCLKCGRPGFDPWLGRSPGGGHGNPCSCLENPHGQRSLAGYSPWGHNQTQVRDSAHMGVPQNSVLDLLHFLPYTLFGVIILTHMTSITTYSLISKSVSLVQAFFLPYLYTICASIYWLVSMCTSRDLKFNKLNIEFIIFLPNQVSSQGIISLSFQTPKPNARISLPPSPKSNYEVLCLQNQYIL